MRPVTDEHQHPTRSRWSTIEWLLMFALAVFAAWAFTEAAKGQGPESPCQHFRDTVVVNDPDRNWQIIWKRGSATDPNSFGFFQAGDPIWDSVTLRQYAGERRLVDHMTIRQQDWFESCYYRAFRVPADTPQGTYSVLLNGESQGVLVVSTRTKPFRTLTGRLTKLVMEPGMTYYAHGATIMGPVTAAPDASLHGATVVDGTFYGLGANMVVKDCRFIRSVVGSMSVDWHNSPDTYRDHGMLFENCTFDHTAVTGCCSGCFLNCTWTGRIKNVGGTPIDSANGHNFVNERAKRLCMFNSTFDRTDRGPILRTSWGPSSDNLYVGIHTLNINSTSNGSEICCIEGDRHSFDRNIVLGWRAFGCNNHWQVWNTKATGNLIGNSIFGPGCTINFSGIEEQEHNQVRYCVLSRPVMVNANGAKATGTTLLDNKDYEK